MAFLTGVALLHQAPALPAAGYLMALLAGAAWLWRCKSFTAAWILLGLCWGWGSAAWRMADVLNPVWEGKDLPVVGVITAIPEQGAARSRFLLAVENFPGVTPRPGPTLVLLNWYEGAPPLRAGDRWRMVVRLKRPLGFRNPGAMDYEGRLFRQGVGATGYVRHQAAAPQRLGASRRPGALLQRTRQHIFDSMATLLENRRHAGILEALAVGERASMDSEHWRVLTATGTSHLVAISGLHVGLVAGLWFAAVRLLWARLPWLANRMAAARAGALAGVTAAAIYSALAGFSVPTQRALIMVAVVMGAVWLRRHRSVSQILGAALFAVLLIDAQAVLDVGFWLSFGAVAVILYGMGGRLGSGGWWWKWGRVQWLVAIGLAPVLVLCFQQLSLVAPLANVVAVPWVSFAVVPAVLGGAVFSWLPAVAAPLLTLAHGAFGLLWTFLHWLAGLPFATWHSGAPAPWAVLAAAAGAVLLISPRGLPGRWLGVVGLLPLLMLKTPRPEHGEVWFTLLDVGQGLSAVVRTADHVLVYDTGPRFPSGFNTGAAVVLPFLRTAGIDRVDLLVVSHGDLDHAGGAADLLAGMPVSRSLEGVPGVLPDTARAQTCRQGQSWQWDGVAFQVLHPGTESNFGENNRSCVIRVSTGSANSVLLTGDIERWAELALLASAGGALASRILVAPHHGSNTSSGASFIDRVDPEYVLFPAGYRNRFRFPHADVVARYRQRSVEMLDTAHSGAITVKLGPGRDDIELDAYRARARRFWHTLP